jgi:3-isopropylmalate dehydratase small subunit
MSKEQTPMTAWEFYENSDTANVYDVMEQYAQYRERKAVLEALENCCGMSREQAVHAIKRMKQK